MSRVSIIGAYNTKFGAFVEKEQNRQITDTKTYYEFLIEAGRGALEDAGIEARDIDGIWLGSCSPSLFVNQEHVAPSGWRSLLRTFVFCRQPGPKAHVHPHPLRFLTLPGLSSPEV